MTLGDLIRERALRDAREEAISLIRECENLWALTGVIHDLKAAKGDARTNSDFKTVLKTASEPEEKPQ